MGRSNADETQQSLRSLEGLICPRCRRRTLAAPASHAVVRCESDGYALVRPADLAESDGDPFLGATVAGRFVILGRLGAGSMGTVYQARQEAMGRDVAVKILRSDRAFDAQAKARFTREAKAMSLLTSPHTVTVFDFGEIEDAGETSAGAGSLYLAMEMLEGESLGTRLKRVKRLPIPDAIRVARHALLSLAEAHDKGIVHRDLKPDNLFLGPAPSAEHEETCKVLDFGIAKVVTDGAAGVDALETQAGTVFGTPRYMSPEQAQGKPLDARSDLYALGVLLYQMLTGRAPFVDDDAVVVMARHIKSLPEVPMDAAPDAAIPPALSAVVMRALSKDPGDRQQSAKEFIAALDGVLLDPKQSPGSQRTDTALATGALAAVVGDDLANSERSAASQRGPGFFGRSPWLVAAIAALALGATAMGMVRVRPSAVIEARSGLDRAATARIEAVRRSTPAAADAAGPNDAAVDTIPDHAASAAPNTTGAAASPPVPAVAPAARRPKKYTRFD